MGRLKFFLLCYIITCQQDMVAQKLEPIPNLTFWNTTYQYNFHPISSDQTTNISFPLSENLHYEIQAEKISQCFDGHSRYGQFDCREIDTNLNTLLKKVEFQFSKASIISLDYDDGRDTNYTLLLTYIYNATITNDSLTSWFLLNRAETYFDKISRTSQVKSIAFIQMANAQRMVRRRTGRDIDEVPLNDVYKMAVKFTHNINASYQTLADWYEALGDFWFQWGEVAKYKDCYNKAREYESTYNDLSSCIQLQRIHEKLFFDLDPKHIQGNVYGDFVSSNIKAQEDQNIKHIEEFQYRNQLLAYFYGSVFKGSSMAGLPDHYLESNPRILPWDMLTFVDVVRPVFKNNNDYEADKKVEIIWMNMVAKYKLIRFENFAAALDNLFTACIMTNDFRNARIVNQYIFRLPKGQSNEHFFEHQINAARIYTYDNQIDSAKIILSQILVDVRPIENDVIGKPIKKRCYDLLRVVAQKESNLELYDYYSEKMKAIQKSIDDDQNDISLSIAKEDKVISQGYLVDQIDYYKAWGEQNVLLANKNDSIAKTEFEKRLISDTLRIEQARNDSLIKKRTKDSLLYESQRADSEKKDKEIAKGNTVFAYVISACIVMFLLVMGVFIWRSKEKIKEQDEAKKKQLEAEKVKLELESLRAPYLSHAIGNNFTYIQAKIRMGLEKSDKTQLESAITISQRLGNLFRDISHNSTGQTSLMEEFNRGKKYVSLMSECSQYSIQFISSVDEKQANTISVPNFSLLDFYINAVTHGQLMRRKNSWIKTTFQKNNDTGEFLLSIEDSGVGIQEHQDEEDQTHQSTGHDRVVRRFEIFNLEHSTHIYFDKKKDFLNILDENGNIIGAKITIKIIP